MTNHIELTLTYRGVPVGTAVAGPENAFNPDPGDSQIDPREAVDLVFLQFQPGPGYASIQPIVRRAWRAVENFGYLGPAADPASDMAGQDAAATARTLWAALELRDARGRQLPGRVVTFYEDAPGATRPYWLDVSVERADAWVAATILSPHRGDTRSDSLGSEQPEAI